MSHQTFFEEDSCALKSNPGVVGVVERTWHDVDGHTPLSERLDGIKRHQDVPENQYKKFLALGTPPRQHALVQFLDPAYGALLIHESHLILLDRALEFGDIVKKNATQIMSGTVINTSRHCDLVPSFPTALSSATTTPYSEERANSQAFEGLQYTSNPLPNQEGVPFFFDIPAAELQFTESYRIGDFVTYHGWLGRIEETFDEVTVRLEDGGIVVVELPDELELPVGLQDTKDMSKLDTMPVDRIAVGDLVVTKKGNLRRGEWKQRSYNPSTPPRGYVVGVERLEIEVRWLFQNFLSPDRQGIQSEPPNLLNLKDYRHQGLRVYDRGRLPPRDGNGSDNPAGFTNGSDIGIADRVRFRDLTGACVKYDGSSVTRTGQRQAKLKAIPPSSASGYDLNTFYVIGTKSFVTVLWQDMTTTEEESTALVPYINVDDNDVWPGEIVAVKEGSQLAGSLDQGRAEGAIPSSGVAAGTFHDEEVYRPKKVGIVQSVDALGRIACIRWFLDPKLELAGDRKSILLPGSHCGPLSDNSEEVSFYEISAFPALTKRRGDFVLVGPSISSYLSPPTGSEDANNGDFVLPNSVDGNELASMIGSIAGTLVEPSSDQAFNQFSQLQSAISSSGLLPATSAALSILARSGAQHVRDAAAQMQAQLASVVASGQSSPIDWFGEIVDLGLDGLVTVRLCGLPSACDIRVPIERLTVIMNGDEEDGDEGFYSDSSDNDGSENWWSSDAYDSYESDEVLEQTIEYEGGERLDADGGDDVWLTDEEGCSVADSDTTLEDVDEQNQAAQSEHADLSSQKLHDPAMDPAYQLSGSNGQLNDKSVDLSVAGAFTTPSCLESPLNFAILDEEPPAGHHFIGNMPDLTSNLMRRIRKEHKILEKSLPEGIYVRTWESRLDIIRVLILGPRNTPYELAPFVIDFQFGNSFPSSPPAAFFHSWTAGMGRVNPNLYEDGKICLSLLGTWPADAKNESWSPQRSSMLQILVSLMGLVLVKEPFYNEAGFDILVGSEDSQVSSNHYTERAFVLSRGFIKHALQHPTHGLQDVVHWLYLSPHPQAPKLLRAAIADAQDILRNSQHEAEPAVHHAREEGGEASNGSVPTSSSSSPSSISTSSSREPDALQRVSAGASILLRKQVAILQDILAKQDSS
ncbi:hypothetical protein L228DRAFT_244114 [Xylona heveae TC161]|uniref:UBC core domain-containing protein n=1 Tax=Xylona heveae (strain CBS 132557 / TC161) TaxID=1328760 RepID=A0A165IS70_XYLHT|nr:hypothetical protein L228DRAFT_244114 [Xylona heveae TC161]KZF25308.1 hypothetical protein L228DRAFT_244114 [Xylona heveae TC161]